MGFFHVHGRWQALEDCDGWMGMRDGCKMNILNADVRKGEKENTYKALLLTYIICWKGCTPPTPDFDVFVC